MQDPHIFRLGRLRAFIRNVGKAIISSNSVKSILSIASIALLAAAPVAQAVPFSITSATVTTGSGYGVDANENGGKLLDVLFTETLVATQNSELSGEGDWFTFNIGTVELRELSDHGGITADETDGLDVTWTFTFTDPLESGETISTTPITVSGTVNDDAVDYTLDWGQETVDFAGGQFSISLNDLSLSRNSSNPDGPDIDGHMKTQTATITLLELDGVSSSSSILSVPEPGSLALMGLGLAGLGYRRKKQA